MKGLVDGMPVIVGGIILEKKTKTTKSNNMMAFVTLEDLYGSMEVIVFPTVLARYAGLLTEENIVWINGRLSIKEEEQPKIICEEVSTIQKTEVKRLYLKLENTLDPRLEQSILPLLKYFSGNTPVCICREGEKKGKFAERDYWVRLEPCLLDELKSRLGEGNVKVV